MKSKMRFWLNGEFKDETAAIGIADRGLLLADGVFETLLLVDGQPAFFTAHLDRLRAAAAALGINAAIDAVALERVVQELAVRNGAGTGLGSCRITLTRGAGPRGLGFKQGAAAATLLITVAAYQQPAQTSPARLIVSDYRRNEHNLTSRLKTLNYLDNVMARQEAAAAGVDEAVMLNTGGRVTCAAAANIFLIARDAVITPPVSEGALPGIVRGLLIAEAESVGIKIREEPVALGTLLTSPIVLTNSLTGLRSAAFRECAAPGGDAQKTITSLKSCYETALLTDLARQKAAG